MEKTAGILGKLKKKKVWVPIVVVLAGIIFWGVFRGGEGGEGIEIAEVKKETVSRKISETGLVEPSAELALGFSGGGRIDAIFVSEGQKVEAGTALASVESASERATHESALAKVRADRARIADAKDPVSAEDRGAAEASVEAAEISLQNTRVKQNLAVENAEEALLNNDLEAELLKSNVSGDEVDTSPAITGVYESEERGTYVLELYESNAESGYSFRYFFEGEDGEKTDERVGTVTTDTPEQLGDRGLYIEFPDNFAKGLDTVWVIPIPNDRSSTYLSFKNAYEAAKDTREATIEEAEANLKSAKANARKTLQGASENSLDVLRATLKVSEAALASARAALDDTIITAPISGIVADTSIDVGEVTSPGTPVVTLLSSESFSITAGIPEADIIGLDEGDMAEITFDAYDDLTLPARVVFVSPRALTDQGVTTVEVKLAFESKDERLKAGITADAEIHTEKKENVLAVPSRAVIEEDGQKYVRVLPEGVKKGSLTIENIAEKLGKMAVETGLRGTDGLVEITNGLEGGEQVVTFLPEEFRKAF